MSAKLAVIYASNLRGCQPCEQQVADPPALQGCEPSKIQGAGPHVSALRAWRVWVAQPYVQTRRGFRGTCDDRKVLHCICSDTRLSHRSDAFRKHRNDMASHLFDITQA